MQSFTSIPGVRAQVVRGLVVWVAVIGSVIEVPAYPPAPDHILYGLVRDEDGQPLPWPSASIELETADGLKWVAPVVETPVEGINFNLRLPMDSGRTPDAAVPNALRPAVPFRIQVRIGTEVYVPMEMSGAYRELGKGGDKTRIDLTLGEDTDGDGLPDAWERALLARLGASGTLADIRPGDDLEGDGLSNRDRYLAGVYGHGGEHAFRLQAMRAEDGMATLEFLAVKGRTYTVEEGDALDRWKTVAFVVSEGAAPVSQWEAQEIQRLRIRVPATADSTAEVRFFRLWVR